MARVIIETDDPKLRRLPWYLWDLVESRPLAEVALSPATFERVDQSVKPKAKVRILAILGDSSPPNPQTGFRLNLNADISFFERLPDAETVRLVEPKGHEFNETLWDKKGWDILFFAGHSSSHPDGTTGQMDLNSGEFLTIEDLKYALKEAIERGLQLAIFNSCDGLGLAQNLAELNIPQIIVMREPIPDQVAHKFLEYFLEAFSSGESLYIAVRKARKRLHGLEKYFPCASWLPVICQNPTVKPVSWQEMVGTKSTNLDEQKQEDIANWIRKPVEEKGQYATNESLENAVTEAIKIVKKILPQLKAKNHEPYPIIKEIIRLTPPEDFLLEQVLQKVCDPEVQIPDGDKSEWLESIVRSVQIFKESLQVLTEANEKEIVKGNGLLAKKFIDKTFCKWVEDWTDRLYSLGYIEKIRDREFDTIKSCVEHHIENLKKGGMWQNEQIPTIEPTNDGANVFRVTVSNCAYKEGCQWGLGVPEFRENGKYRCQRLGCFVGAVKKYLSEANLPESQREKLDYLMTTVMDENQGCQGLIFVNENFMRQILVQKYPTQFPASSPNHLN